MGEERAEMPQIEQNKKAKNSSFVLKSNGRADYKVASSKLLDVLAAVVSVLIAVLIWALN